MNIDLLLELDKESIYANVSTLPETKITEIVEIVNSIAYSITKPAKIKIGYMRDFDLEKDMEYGVIILKPMRSADKIKLEHIEKRKDIVDMRKRELNTEIIANFIYKNRQQVQVILAYRDI